VRQVQAALAGSFIEANDRQLVSGPAGPEVRDGSVGWDRKDELDLAYVRREADTATHGTNIRSSGQRPSEPILPLRFYSERLGKG